MRMPERHIQEKLFDAPAQGMVRDAYLSPCGLYRYNLSRVWDAGLPSVCFVMLNPSTADASQDDNTIRRCIGFAKAWGYGRLDVVNLFAYRATKPEAMKKAAEPVGPCNDQCLRIAVDRASLVVAAWGIHGSHRDRAKEVMALLTEGGRTVHCFGATMSEQPFHPLYLPSKVKLMPFTPSWSQKPL